MKIYSKTGDNGDTGLIGGRRVGKDDILIGVLGCLDELGAVLGMCRAEVGFLEGCEGVTEAVIRVIADVQDDLMVMGAVLAGGSGLRELQVEKLEKEIDKVSDKLPELKGFILSGGGRAGAQLHFARAVCRRCERVAVNLSKNEDWIVAVDRVTISACLAYLNRLSDLLFVLARWVNLAEGIDEAKWGNE